MIRESFALDPADGDAALEIVIPSGEVRVERGPAGSVTVEIDTKNPDRWEVARRGRTIEVVCGHNSFLRSERARVRIAAPDASDVSVRTGSADVNLGISATRVEVNTASGDLRVARAASLRVKSASGSIRIGEVVDESALRSASGDVSATSLLGELSVTTASGDVRVEHAAGRVHAATASGDIVFTRYDGPSLTANSMSGDVIVGLPSGRTVECDARSLSGRVELPAKRSGAERGAATTSESDDGLGDDGDGGGGVGGIARRVQLRLKSVSGDVRIRRAD